MREKTELTHWISKVAGRLSLLFWMIMLCGTLSAQSARTITIQMLDSKTGKPISTSQIEVRIRASQNSTQTAGIPPLYVRPNKDGVGEATFPVAASEIRVYARDGVWSYVNCDSVKDRGANQEHWYSISEILASGVTAPNYCSKRKVVAKPGEFMFFVRPMTFLQKMHE
jgi:hypothetical protein